MPTPTPIPIFARVESSSLGMFRAAGAVEGSTEEEWSATVVVSDGVLVGVTVAGVETGAEVVTASRNCQPLNGMPSTNVDVAANVEVFSHPESPPKLLANSKNCPSDMVEMH